MEGNQRTVAEKEIMVVEDEHEVVMHVRGKDQEMALMQEGRSGSQQEELVGLEQVEEPQATLP